MEPQTFNVDVTQTNIRKFRPRPTPQEGVQALKTLEEHEVK